MHYQDDDIAYGEALLEAVDLDKSGTSPRLVIGPSVEALISKQLSSYDDNLWAPHYYQLLEDPRDERLFVNYLSATFEYFPDGPIDWWLLEKHKENVLEGLRKYEADPRVWRKYMWAAIYHNYVCETFADQFQGRGDGEVDPEEAAIGAEAQRVVDYLVPIKAPPEEWIPRQLNALRLRQRLAPM